MVVPLELVSVIAPVAVKPIVEAPLREITPALLIVNKEFVEEDKLMVLADDKVIVLDAVALIVAPLIAKVPDADVNVTLVAEDIVIAPAEYKFIVDEVVVDRVIPELDVKVIPADDTEYAPVELIE
jgi:hypothetical protein